jgi:ribonuclease HI
MRDASPRQGDRVVVIYADGTGEPDRGPGGWGAVLTHGNHVREISGCKWQTTDARMTLLAVLRALECLKRPVPVRIWVGSEHVQDGVTRLLAPPEVPRSAWNDQRNIDLWVRLAAAARPHDVNWIWADSESAESGYGRAVALAQQGLETARDKEPPCEGRGGGGRDLPLDRSETLARLAATIAIVKDRHPLAVWEHLENVTANGTQPPGPVAGLLAALEESDVPSFLEFLDDPALLPLIVPSHRRPQRSEVVTYRIRIDLIGAKPPVWRRVELASDLYLDDVHAVIQTAFDWTDTHLHVFSSGSHIYSRDSEDYLCPHEVEEGKAGTPEEQVRLDEVLVGVRDKIHYIYDFGDSWEYRIRLEAVLPRDDSAPAAICTAGKRAGPEEDCGGIEAYEEMAADDPGSDDFTAGDIEAINETLASFAPGPRPALPSERDDW